MLVAQGRRPHVAQPDRALAAAVHEQVALHRVELSCRYHLKNLLPTRYKWAWNTYLGELLHVRGFDVHNVEALVGDL